MPTAAKMAFAEWKTHNNRNPNKKEKLDWSDKYKITTD